MTISVSITSATIAVIITFLAARLPKGLGVGSTTMGAGLEAAADFLATATGDAATGGATGLGKDFEMGVTALAGALAAGWVVGTRLTGFAGDLDATLAMGLSALGAAGLAALGTTLTGVLGLTLDLAGTLFAGTAFFTGAALAAADLLRGATRLALAAGWATGFFTGLAATEAFGLT